MNIFLPLLIINSVIVWAADDYHSSDGAEIARKNRLLAMSDPRNPADHGGIRSRLGYQRLNVSELAVPFKAFKTGVNTVTAGSEYVSNYFNFVDSAFKNARKGLQDMENSLEKSKARLDKGIGHFGSDWEGDMMKKVKEDPSTYNNVFGKFNQAAISEYHTLMELIRATNKSFYTAGRSLSLSSASDMRSQNKTLSIIAKTLDRATRAFSGMLNHQVLPLLAGTKFGAGAVVPRLQKQIADALEKLQEGIFPALTDESLRYMQTGAENLGNVTSRQLAVAAKSLTKQLAQLRAFLDRAVQKNSQNLSKNFSQIQQVISSGNATISKHMASGITKLQALADNATSTASHFAQGVTETTSDLGQTLSAANAALSDAQSLSDLDGQMILSDAATTLSGLLSKLQSASGSNRGDLNSVQDKIGQVYASGTSLTVSKLQDSVEPRIAALQRISGGDSSTLSSEFEAVSAQTRDLVTNTLQTGVSLSNSNLKNLQDRAFASASSAADDAMAGIDTAAAESDADRAEVLTKFQQSMNQNDNVKSRFDEVGRSIGQSSDSISKIAHSSAAKIAQLLSGNQALLSSQASDMSGANGQISNLTNGALPQLDSDNEARMQSLLGDLTSIRQQASAEGGNFQANSQQLISALISDAVKKNPSVFLRSTGLSDASASLKIAGTNFSSSLAETQSKMSAKMNQLQALYDKVADGGDAHSQLRQAVARQQALLREAAAPLLRSMSEWTGEVPGNLSAVHAKLSSGDRAEWNEMMQMLESRLSDLGQKRSATKSGISQFEDFLAQLEIKIAEKLLTDASDPERIRTATKTRDDAVAEISTAQTEMMRTIDAHMRAANESVTNKTYNFYKQFQTASLVADALVTGFSDYIARMLAVEKASESARNVTQTTLLKSIQSHLANAPVTFTNATQLLRVQALVAQAMNSSDTSQEGMAKRKAAEDALIAEYGTSVAEKLKQQYSMLKANAEAFSADIEAAMNTSVEDRETSVDASRMGLEGINTKALLFQGAASGLLGAQKENAKQISDKIQSLLNGGSFLTNISGSELASILKSVQKSDQLYHSHLSQYRDSSLEQVATLGGVVEDFATLVSTQLNRTRDFLSQLSANYTLLVKRTDAVTTDPINSVKANFTSISDRAHTSNSSLTEHLLSIGPIQEGLQERVQSLSDRQDAFANNIHQQLADMVSSISQLDGQVSVSRNAGMSKLRDALASLKNNFSDQALEFQSEKNSGESGSLLQLESDSQIRSDMNQRILSLKEFLRGNKAF